MFMVFQAGQVKSSRLLNSQKLGPQRSTVVIPREDARLKADDGLQMFNGSVENLD
jgi:hypothetical protein